MFVMHPFLCCGVGRSDGFCVGLVSLKETPAMLSGGCSDKVAVGSVEGFIVGLAVEGSGVGLAVVLAVEGFIVGRDVGVAVDSVGLVVVGLAVDGGGVELAVGAGEGAAILLPKVESGITIGVVVSSPDASFSMPT